VDRRSDIWSFGVVVFEMLVGKRLFPGETATDTMAAVLRQDVDWTILPRETPPAVIRLLKRCLQRDSRERLRDIGDARLDLIDGLSSGLHVPAPTGPPAPIPRRKALSMAAVAAAVLLGVAIGSLRRGAADADAFESNYLTSSGHDRSPSVSPDGKSVAFTSDRDGRSRIWIKQFATAAELPLTEGPMDTEPQFSPDGSMVLFTRWTNGIPSAFRIPSVGGEPRKIIDRAVDATWSPDGQQIAFVRPEEAVPNRPTSASLFVAKSDGGTPRSLKSYEGSNIVHPRWSPNGERIAILVVSGGSANFSVRIVTVANGADEKVPIATAHTRSLAVVWTSDSSVICAGGNNGGGIVNASGGRITAIDLKTGRNELLYSHPDALGDVELAGPNRLVASTQAIQQNIAEWTGPASRRITRGRASDRQPVYSPDGRTVVFSSERSGNLDLWSLSLETGDLRQITDDAASDWDPAFTSDGRLVWSSTRSGVFEIWTAEADGSGSKQLTHDGVDAENPAISRDLKWLVYGSTRPGEVGIWRSQADGSNPKLLVHGTTGLPDISPDGQYVLYLSFTGVQGNGTVEVARLADGKPADFRIPVIGKRITASNLGRARFMPDGKRIAFIAQDEKGANGIFVQDFVPGKDTTSTRRKLTGFDSEVDAETFDVSRDGARVAIASRELTSSLILLERPKR